MNDALGVTAEVFDKGAFDWISATTSEPLEPDEWAHVAMTWDGVELRVLKDHAAVGAKTGIGPAKQESSPVEVLLGLDPDEAANGTPYPQSATLEGALGMVRLHRRVLELDEMLHFPPATFALGALVDADGDSLDTDGDTILDDQDGSLVAGDNPCTAGETVGCDDNCVIAENASQADPDGDGIGAGCAPDGPEVPCCDKTPCGDLNCDDGDPCTDDHCDPEAPADGTLGCSHTPASLDCDDGDECTVDACTPFVGCTATPIEGCDIDADGLLLDQDPCPSVWSPDPDDASACAELGPGWAASRALTLSVNGSTSAPQRRIRALIEIPLTAGIVDENARGIWRLRGDFSGTESPDKDVIPIEPVPRPGPSERRRSG